MARMGYLGGPHRLCGGDGLCRRRQMGEVILILLGLLGLEMLLVGSEWPRKLTGKVRAWFRALIHEFRQQHWRIR